MRHDRELMRIRRAARILATLGCLAGLGGGSSSASAQPAAAPPAGSGAKPTAAAKPKPSAVAAKPAPKAAAKGAPPAKGAPAAAKGKKGSGKGRPASRRAGEPGEPDEAARRSIAGINGRSIHESAELKALRELDRALFPSMAPNAGPPWLAEGTPLIDRGEPRLSASGMPPSAQSVQPAEGPAPAPSADLSWLKTLAMPDIPVRWDARVVRYLDYYKNSPRGRDMVRTWIRKSGRYGASIRRVLREQGLPEDIVWLALVESGFDATIQSPAGAAGLWQFMPEGARIYGLTVDRWIDERLDPERETLAAARYLADLRTRFGNWELAFAAYNMGYGGLLASIRKYNTNDFWELSRFEAGVPYETALYVPKIVAMAIVAKNKSVFGCDEVELDTPVTFDKVAVSPGVSVRSLAIAAGASEDTIEALNPQLLAGRAPPVAMGTRSEFTWTVRVPVGAGPRVAQKLAKLVEIEPRMERYLVRWGESLEDIATRRRVAKGTLVSLNGVRRDEVIRPGTVLFVPAAAGVGAAAADQIAAGEARPKPTVVVPAERFATTDRQRMFYRVVAGDTLRDVAMLFAVSADELCRWNQLDPSATLHDGMTLQIYAPKGQELRDVLALDEKEANVLSVGTPEFFAHFEAQRGRKRVELTAKTGDSWRSIAHKYGLTLGQMERINQRARTSALSAGDKVVVYVQGSHPATAGPAMAKPPPAKAAPEEKADEAVAVAGPADEDPSAPAADDDGVKPAALKKTVGLGPAKDEGVRAPHHDEPVATSVRHGAKSSTDAAH